MSILEKTHKIFHQKWSTKAMIKGTRNYQISMQKCLQEEKNIYFCQIILIYTTNNLSVDVVLEKMLSKFSYCLKTISRILFLNLDLSLLLKHKCMLMALPVCCCKGAFLLSLGYYNLFWFFWLGWVSGCQTLAAGSPPMPYPTV